MGQKSGPVKEPAEQVVKEIRRATRRQFSAEKGKDPHRAVRVCAARTTVPAMSRVTSPSGSAPAISNTSAARPIIR